MSIGLLDWLRRPVVAEETLRFVVVDRDGINLVTFEVDLERGRLDVSVTGMSLAGAEAQTLRLDQAAQLRDWLVEVLP